MATAATSTARLFSGSELQPANAHHLAQRQWLRDLWQFRELFFFFIWRDIKVKYKQCALGIAWAILQPLFTMLVFTLLFGTLARLPSEGAPYPLFYLSALVPWTFFSTALTNSGNSIVSNSGLITKVYFPRLTIPAAAVCSCLVDLAVASVVLFGLIGYYGVGVSWKLLLWPVLLVPLVLAATGCGMALSAMNVRFRDVKYTLPFLTQAWLFITPVIYPTSIVPDRYQFLVALNPVGGIIDAMRAVVLPAAEVRWMNLIISCAVTAVVFAFGLWYFHKTEREFADII